MAVLEAGGVVFERFLTNGRVLGASHVAGERCRIDGRVPEAGGVDSESLITEGRLVRAGVIYERVITLDRVVGGNAGVLTSASRIRRKRKASKGNQWDEQKTAPQRGDRPIEFLRTRVVIFLDFIFVQVD